jgi:hypothetical protein
MAATGPLALAPEINAFRRQFEALSAEADAIRRGLYSAGPYSYTWVGRLMVYLVEPTTRLRAKAPKAFQPAPGRPRHDVMAAFRAYQVQYVDRLRQANGLDLAQARRVLSAEGFPR